MAFDLIIKGGMVIDGTGERSAYRADVGLAQGKIRKIGDLKRESAREVLDADGLVVSPGFIDIQNHSDSYGAMLRDRALPSMLAQGFTSILVGHCGSSLAPLLRGSLASIQKWTDIAGVNVSWRSMAEFATEFSRTGLGPNIGTLVGHATLRREFAGDTARALSPRELTGMKDVLTRSMREGAWGLSIGLEYAHGRTSEEKELVELLSTTAKKKGVASFHLRDEGREVTAALAEVLFLVKQTDVRAKIAHFKMRSEEDVSYAAHTLETLEKARAEGHSLYFDVYPYTQSASVLYLLLPTWATEEGRDELFVKLNNPDLREEIILETREKQYPYKKIRIAQAGSDRTLLGRSIAELAQNSGNSPEEVILRLLTASYDRAVVFFENIDEGVLELFLSHPLSMIATDGSGLRPEDRALPVLAHPRSFGTSARVLGHYVREKKILTLESAIHKMSGLPASFWGVRGRGMIYEGAWADLVIFWERTIKERATYEHPYSYPEGIEYVCVNGKVVFHHGHFTGESAGRILLK